MTQHNPIGWVEIPVTDLDRAEQFYSNYLGWTFERQPEVDNQTMSWFTPMKMDSYGSTATLIKGPSYTPSTDGTLVYFTAPEETVTGSVAKAKEQNIEVLLDVYAIGEHGFIAILKDSEGNRFAIHSMKK